MDKVKLDAVMKEVLTQERSTDKYTDGVLDMYNAILKQL